MATNFYPNVGKISLGFDRNYFSEVIVTATDFGSNSVDLQQPDAVITFPSKSVLFLNLASSGTVDVSLNGYTKHFELSSTGISKSLSFDNRTISKIWLRLKPGDTGIGSQTIQIMAWSD